MLREVLGRVTGRNQRFPKARIVELGGHSAVFETTNSVEDYRAHKLGGERELVEQYVGLVDEGMDIWDVGANIGVFSLFAARASAQVHSFEPDPKFAERLKRNVYLNGWEDSVTIHEMALSDSNGETTLYTDGVGGMSPGLSKSDDETRNEVTVDQRRGDGLEIRTPDLLKIDVEGAEARVVRGMTGILDRVDTVMVEIHPTMLPRFGDSPEDVTDVLESHGFSESYNQKRSDQTHVIYQR